MIEGLTRDEQIKVCGVFAQINLELLFTQFENRDGEISWSKRKNREGDESKIMYQCNLNNITHERMT